MHKAICYLIQATYTNTVNTTKRERFRNFGNSKDKDNGFL